MTHHTDAERAAFEEFASVNGERPELVARNQAGEYQRLDTATGWMWWQAARRAPAAPVPDVTDAMIEAANEAYCPFGDMHLAIQAALAAAPQPPEGLKRENPATKPEAAPVQLPVELLERIQESLGSFVSDQGWSQSDMDTADALDGLLAAHGIKEQST